MVGLQAPPAWAVLDLLAVLRFAPPLAQRPVHLVQVAVPAGPVALPELVVLVVLVEPAARSPNWVRDLF